MLQRKVLVDVVPTPDELAFVFCNMDDEQQAMFFNEIARITDKWDKPFCFHLQSLSDHPALTADGRRIMEQIGDYGSSS